VATPEDVYGITAECRRLIEHAQATGWSDPAVQSELGSIWDYQQQIDGLVAALAPPPPGPTPAPPQPAAAYLGFAVTYAGHGEAADVYLGRTAEQREYGPHHALDLLAPAGGRVEAYQFPTPLAARIAADPEYTRRYDELFGQGWVCLAPLALSSAGGENVVGSQVMYVAVWWPDGGLRLPNGQLARACWFGHVRGDIPAGRVEAGGRIATSWNSGIDFERAGITARAAHVHVCGSATGTLSMNGDVAGMLVAAALGWAVEFRGAGGPGPQDYQSGQWIAGKPRSAWAGHPIPSVP
jgi:hypothetical protein